DPLVSCPLASGGGYKICNNFRGAVGSSNVPQNISIKIDYPIDVRNQIIALGNTLTLRPTLINEFRFNFSRQFLGSNLDHPYPESVSGQTQVEQVLAPFHIPSQPHNPTPLFDMNTPGGGYVTFGPMGWVNMHQAAEAYTIVDNLTKIMGKHTLKTGFMY